MLKSIARPYDSIVVSNLLVMGSGMVGLILTSRYLGVADRGAYLTWSSWAALIGTLALLGAEAYIVVAAHSQEVTISVRSLRPMLFLGLGTAAIGTAAVLWIVAQDIEVVVGGVLAAASSQIVAINNHVQLANSHHGWRFNLARALTPVAGLSAVVIGLYLLEPSAETLFLCLGLGLISGSVASLWLTSEAHPRIPGFGRAVWRFARRGALLTLLMWIVFNGDTVLVSVFGSSEDVGLYGVGVAARGVVVAVGSAVGMKWFATRDVMGRRTLARSMLPVCGTALAAVLAAPWLVPLVLGEGFRAAIPCVQILAMAGVAASLDFLLARMLMVHDVVWSAIGIRVVALLVLVAGVAIVDGDPMRASLVFLAMSGWTVGAELLMLRRTRRVGVRGSRSAVPSDASRPVVGDLGDHE